MTCDDDSDARLLTLSVLEAEDALRKLGRTRDARHRVLHVALPGERFQALRQVLSAQDLACRAARARGDIVRGRGERAFYAVAYGARAVRRVAQLTREHAPRFSSA